MYSISNSLCETSEKKVTISNNELLNNNARSVKIRESKKCDI